MKGDCGIHTIAAVTGDDFDQVKDMFVERFGKTHIVGSDMRTLLTERGWRWTHAYAMNADDLPKTGSVVVVTRRGFYAVVDGVPHNEFNATICGYYEEPMAASLSA